MTAAKQCHSQVRLTVLKVCRNIYLPRNTLYRSIYTHTHTLFLMRRYRGVPREQALLTPGRWVYCTVAGRVFSGWAGRGRVSGGCFRRRQKKRGSGIYFPGFSCHFSRQHFEMWQQRLQLPWWLYPCQKPSTKYALNSNYMCISTCIFIYIYLSIYLLCIYLSKLYVCVFVFSQSWKNPNAGIPQKTGMSDNCVIRLNNKLALMWRHLWSL